MDNAKQNGTKHNLVLAALSLFARDGINAVSMRTINTEAGAKNASAVHYHFGNKIGIISAVIEFIRNEHRVFLLPKLDHLEALAEKDELTLRTLYSELVEAYLSLSFIEGFGNDIIYFYARILSDISPEVEELLNADPLGVNQRILALIDVVLPDMPEDVKRFRLATNTFLIIHGIARTRDLESTFGLGNDEERLKTLHRFIDYLVGAMAAPVSPAGL